jgi:hypothetical protein
MSRFKADLFRGIVVASDETGMRVGDTNRWLWVFHHGPTAVFLGAQSRAKTVIGDFTATMHSLHGRRCGASGQSAPHHHSGRMVTRPIWRPWSARSAAMSIPPNSSRFVPHRTPTVYYSPAECTAFSKTAAEGKPEVKPVLPSYVDGQIIPVQLHSRRRTGLTKCSQRTWKAA